MSRRRKFVATPELKRAHAIGAFRRARINFLNDCDSDWPISPHRSEGNRRALVREWRRLHEKMAKLGEEIPDSILGTDPRVEQVLREAGALQAPSEEKTAP